MDFCTYLEGAEHDTELTILHEIHGLRQQAFVTISICAVCIKNIYFNCIKCLIKRLDKKLKKCVDFCRLYGVY